MFQMDKKQQKQFRTELYKKHGANYMADAMVVERLYDADFNWVMLEAKAGWPVREIWKAWSRRFIATQKVCVELLGNTVALEGWNDMVTALAPYDPEQLRKCLLAGMTPEVAKAYISSHLPDYAFDQCIHSYIQLVSPELKASMLTRGEPVMVTQWRAERQEVLERIGRDKMMHREVSPHTNYELLRLNWLIGDNQPIGGRVTRLKHTKLGLLHSYDAIHDERNRIAELRRKKEFINNPTLYAMATAALQELDLIIKHCDPKYATFTNTALGEPYDEYTKDVTRRIAASMKLPAYLLTAPMPPVDSFIKKHYHTSKENPVCTHCGYRMDYHKKKEFPGGHIIMGGASGAGKLRASATPYMIFDCNEDGSLLADVQPIERITFNSVIDPEVLKSIFNYDKSEPTMQNQTQSPKEQKRARIKAIEQELSKLHHLKIEIDAMDNSIKNVKNATMQIQMQVVSPVGYHSSVIAKGMQSVSPAAIFNLYKQEVSEHEIALNTELNGLIS